MLAVPLVKWSYWRRRSGNTESRTTYCDHSAAGQITGPLTVTIQQLVRSRDHLLWPFSSWSDHGTTYCDHSAADQITGPLTVTIQQLVRSRDHLLWPFSSWSDHGITYCDHSAADQITEPLTVSFQQLINGYRVVIGWHQHVTREDFTDIPVSWKKWDIRDNIYTSNICTWCKLYLISGKHSSNQAVNDNIRVTAAFKNEVLICELIRSGFSTAPY